MGPMSNPQTECIIRPLSLLVSTCMTKLLQSLRLRQWFQVLHRSRLRDIPPQCLLASLCGMVPRDPLVDHLQEPDLRL